MVRKSASQKQPNIQVQLSLEHPTGNFWVDNGLAALCDLVGMGNYPVKQVLEELRQRLVQKTGNKSEYRDEATGELREYDKVNWVYPTNLFIKVVGRAPKQKSHGKEYFTQPPRLELSLQFKKKKGYCDICGALAPPTDAKMWMFPFVVEPGKFGNFYSWAKRGANLCPRCAVAGVAGYLTWLWVAQGRDALHFFLFYTNLREMARLHREVLQPLRLEGGKGGNVRLPFYGPYLHETTLGLLLELFSHVRRSDRLTDEGREFLASLLGATAALPPAPLTLYAIMGKIMDKRGQAFKMQVFREFSHLHALYRLYETWIKAVGGDNPQQTLAGVFRQFQTREGNQYNTLWREKVGWAVLEFGDPLPYVEAFLFEARAKEKSPSPLSWETESVFYYYAKEVLNMDEGLLKVLGGFGHRLGPVAREKNEMGILYALRNAKNPEEFFRVLNDIQFRLELTVPEKLLEIGQGERIAGNPWVRVKTLLSIYAMNSYLWAGRSPATAEQGGDAA